jgi:hypothetical protein
MGYTHYWKKSLVLDQDKFNAFVEDCREICNLATKEYDINICGWDGEGKPEFTPDFVSLNGDHSKDDGCETFRFTSIEELQYANEYGLVFGCTKTARNPYDIVVTACLVAAKYHFGNDVYISSDGEGEENTWSDGFMLASAILGPDLKELGEKLFERPSKDLIKTFSVKLNEIKKEMMKDKPVPHSISSKDTAKLIRTELKRTFPYCKFSVKSDYDSINVRWNNGPSEEKVKEKIGQYQTGHYEEITKEYGFDSSPYNNKYLFYQREIDHDIVVRESRRVSLEWGVILPDDTDYYNLRHRLWIEGEKKGDSGNNFEMRIMNEVYSNDY